MKEHHSPSDLIRNILRYSKVSRLELLVLLVLAEYSYHAKVEMSQKELAKLAHLSERQVRRFLDGLIEKGQITVERAGNGRGHSARYHVHVTPYFHS